MPTKITVPTIHLNGTDAATLADQNSHANRAVNAAIKALVDAMPNARDYYTQGDEAHLAATNEWADRLTRLRSVKDELTLLTEAIVEQKEARECRKAGK